MRSDGLASWLPSTGVIVKSLASAAACAWADAEAWALLWAGETVEWLPLLHAVTSRPMGAAAAMPAYRRARRPGLRSVPRTVTLLLPRLATDAVYLRSANGRPGSVP